MCESIKSIIFKRLEESPPHSIFFLSDFAELGSLETVRKVFLQARLIGLVSHLSHGIYIKPMMSRFGEVPPSLEAVAKEIAKRDYVKIMPTGSTAANTLGLSTQIPMTVSYLTTGSSRTINIGKRLIRFKHAAPKNFAYKGTTIPLIVQALRDMGKENVNENIMSSLALYMDKANDKENFAHDILLAPAWIQTILKPLVTEKMKHWQQYNETEKLQLLDITAAKTGLPRLAVEKDWWVTMVLRALSLTQYSSLMSFKGGTSLSKGWQLIERFSEDIDIALKREDRFAIAGISNNQLAKARRIARHYIVRELPEDLNTALSSMGVTQFTVEAETERIKDGVTYEMRADTHPSVVYVNYNSIVPETAEYLQPRVKIEISCLSMDEPVQQKTLRSFISEVVPESEDVTVNFKVHPTNA